MWLPDFVEIRILYLVLFLNGGLFCKAKTWSHIYLHQTYDGHAGIKNHIGIQVNKALFELLFPINEITCNLIS